MRKFISAYIFLILSFATSAQITDQKTDDGILIKDGIEKVLFYQVKPKSRNGEYERCNYIHPLWGIDGNVLTEDFPADHLHQRGIFWAWHQIFINGKRIGDGWEINDFEQKVSDTKFVSTKGGLGILKTEVEWKSDLWKNQGKKVPYLKENAAITIHPKKSNYRKIDFEIELLALEKNLKIGGSEDIKGYSGFSVRMVLPDDIKFAGPDGEIVPEITAVKSKGYVNISGSIGPNKDHGGIVIVDHPDNPDYPQFWILRATKSMQNAAYPGRESIPLSTSKPLILKYSLIIYSGKIANNQIAKVID